MDFLVVGLGNPGTEYANTRHNVGFLVLDQFETTFTEKEAWQASIAQISLGHKKVLLVKPLTFMNNSGTAVQTIQSFYKIPPENVIVIYDDIDLPFGLLRIKVNRSAAGHNGIKSLLSLLGPTFIRVRVGIQDPQNPQKAQGYVLQPFTTQEQATLPDVLQKAKNSVVHLIERGLTATMNTFNNT